MRSKAQAATQASAPVRCGGKQRMQEQHYAARNSGLETKEMREKAYLPVTSRGGARPGHRRGYSGRGPRALRLREADGLR